MKNIFLVFLLFLSSYSKAAIVDKFICQIHGYGIRRTPLNFSAKVDVARKVVSRDANSEITEGEAKFNIEIEMESGDILSVQYMHKYAHYITLSPLGKPIEARQSMCRSFNVNNVGTGSSYCNQSYSVPVNMDPFPFYNAEKSGDIVLMSERYIVQANCLLIDSEVDSMKAGGL